VQFDIPVLPPSPPTTLPVVHKHEPVRAQQREAERQAEHLFQALLYWAFRGEV
jgi:type I restriction enzyme S subunit